MAQQAVAAYCLAQQAPGRQQKRVARREVGIRGPVALMECLSEGGQAVEVFQANVDMRQVPEQVQQREDEAEQQRGEVLLRITWPACSRRSGTFELRSKLASGRSTGSARHSLAHFASLWLALHKTADWKSALHETAD